MHRLKSSGNRGPLLITGLLLAAAAGCTQRATLTLVQDFAPPSQQRLALASDVAHFTSDGARQVLVMTFPHPGSENGPRMLFVYIDAPDQTRPAVVDPDDSVAVRGFMVQEVGSLAGKSSFVSGQVRVHPVLFQPDLRTAEINLTTEDGAHLLGQATLDRAPAEIRRLARPYGGDIKDLAARPDEPDQDAPPENTSSSDTPPGN